jgi:hypothetical protein
LVLVPFIVGAGCFTADLRLGGGDGLSDADLGIANA